MKPLAFGDEEGKYTSWLASPQPQLLFPVFVKVKDKAYWKAYKLLSRIPPIVTCGPPDLVLVFPDKEPAPYKPWVCYIFSNVCQTF